MGRKRTKQRYTGFPRVKRSPSVKKDLETRFGDRTERKEKNLREPFVTLDSYASRLKRLPDGKTRAQGWNALRQAWFAFRIFKSKFDLDGMIKQAHSVRREQANLGIALTEFTDPVILVEPYITEDEKEYFRQQKELEGIVEEERTIEQEWF
jgi:hypothetical protein